MKYNIILLYEHVFVNYVSLSILTLQMTFHTYHLAGIRGMHEKTYPPRDRRKVSLFGDLVCIIAYFSHIILYIHAVCVSPRDYGMNDRWRKVCLKNSSDCHCKRRLSRTNTYTIADGIHPVRISFADGRGSAAGIMQMLTYTNM